MQNGTSKLNFVPQFKSLEKYSTCLNLNRHVSKDSFWIEALIKAFIFQLEGTKFI